MNKKKETNKYSGINLASLKETNELFQFPDTGCIRKTGKLKISGVGDILQYSNPEYLLEPILYEKTSNLLTAYAGVGKSVLSLSIAHALVTGLPLWGHFEVRRKESVLVIDEENPGSFLKDRLVRMGFKEGMPIYFLHYQSIKLDDPVCFTSLVEVVRNLKPELVIFDALIRLHTAKENDNSEMAQVMGKIRELINQTGITALIIHHDRKGQGNRKERARGGGDIVGAVDNQLCLEPEGDDTLLLSPGKARVAPFKPIRLKLESEGEALTFVYQEKDKCETEGVLKVVTEILSRKSMGVNEIRQAIQDRGLFLGRDALRGILKQATGSELVVEKGSRGKLTYKVKPTFPD